MNQAKRDEMWEKYSFMSHGGRMMSKGGFERYRDEIERQRGEPVAWFRKIGGKDADSPNGPGEAWEDTEILMDYSEAAESIARTICKVASPLSEKQKLALVGAVAVWLDKAWREGREHGRGDTVFALPVKKS